MQSVQTAEQFELCASALSGQSAQQEAAGQVDADAVVSFHAELPEPLQQAMTSFIERYPNWDQYRLVQAALAGFLVQTGSSPGRSPVSTLAICFAVSPSSRGFEFGSSPSESGRLRGG